MSAARRLRIKRVYEPAARRDGRRILVDRLWPRGLAKAAARIDYWAANAAPSAALRRWYGHEPDQWPEFRRRYFAELDRNPDAVAALRAALGRGTATLLFGTREPRLNNAAALREYLEAERPPTVAPRAGRGPVGAPRKPLARMRGGRTAVPRRAAAR